MKNKKDNTEHSPKFELVIQVRDNKGNLVNKTKTYSTDDASELEQLWIKNNSQNSRDKYEKSEARRHRNKRPTGTDKNPDGQTSEG